MKRTYYNQFTISEETPLYIPQFLLNPPYVDESWGNEVCPRFTDLERRITVWVDYDQPEHRENPGLTVKYTVVELVGPDHTEPADVVLFATESELEFFHVL